MGADVSAERGRYTSQQKADFERRYREMYGENLSREELLERYRMEKLKADRKRRLEEAKAAQDSEQRHRSDDEYASRSHRRRRDSRDRYDDRTEKQKNDNFRIIKQEHDRRQREYQREHRSHRSRGHRDDRKKQEHRSRQRRTSSKNRDRSRSSSSSSKENRQNRKSSDTMKSSERERDSRSRREKERSSRHKERDGRERSRRREDTKHSSRSRSKHVKEDSESDSEDDQRGREEDSDRKSSKPNMQKTSKTVRSKKRKSQARAEHYKSAPDLTVNREYGKGPWGRAHDFFDSYEQRPQSWVEEIATERNSVMPAPVMERQIIYSMPHIAPQVDGIGFPLSHVQPFSSIPLQSVYNQQPQGRPHSVDVTAQEPPVQARAAEEMQSAPTAVKIPAGAVPALGPNAKPKKVFKQKQRDEQKTKSSKSSQQRSRTLQSKHTSQPTGQTPSRHGQSATLPRSDGPTPKPRMRSLGDPKSPVHIQSVKVMNLSPNRSGQGKKQKGRITSFSAREDFESLLASDYGASNMMNEDLVTNYPTSYPGNYRPNQEIFVDDVIIRNHVPLEQQASTDSDSEGVTDEEHVLTLGENLSPNSYDYSSGFDLEIPEGFTFDSDTSTNKGSPKRKKASTKSREKIITPTAVKPVYGLQGNHKSGKQQTLVLTSIEPISRSKDNKKDKTSKNADRRSKNKRTTSTDQPSSPVRERAISQNSATMQNKGRKHRHSSSPETHEKNNPSRSPGRKSRHSSQQSQNRHNSDQYEPQVYPTNASMQKSTRDADGKGNRTNKRVQHPSKKESTERIIMPSKTGWSSEKITHDIGVGTKPWQPELKSTAVQTPKKKQRPPQPPAQPIYFLKPISSQEVFIEDSSLVSHSETDMSRSRITPAISERGRTATSCSGSSTMSPNTEYTEQSEVESAIPFQRNSVSRVGMKKHTSSLSSTASFDPEPVRVVQPAMKIGISESIQADHYTSSGGQVFFITRSRHGSPPASLKALTEDMKSIDEQSEDAQQRSPNIATQDPHEFDAHEVGKWVLDCYAQDQKLKSNAIQSEPTITNPPVPVNQVRLTKQSAVEYDTSFTLPSPHEESAMVNQTTVVPLTEEALQNHNGNIPRYSSQSSKSSTEVTGDNIDIARQAPDHGVFQQEMIVTKNKIKRFSERERTPEPSWKSEKYQSKLNHWNTSPSGNVVLAEVCSVNDTEDTSSAVSIKSPTPEPVHVPSPQPQIQIPITKNTRVIRPNNNHRPRYNEETIVPSNTATTAYLHQGSEKVQGSVSSSSTDMEEGQSLPNVPVAVHSQLDRQVGEPSHYSGVSSHSIGKPVTANATRLKHAEPARATAPYQSIQSRRQPSDDFGKASNIPTQQHPRANSTSSSRSRSCERQPLRKAPGRSFEQQQVQAPEWSKKPSIAARSHNRQPYLEKIARASEVNSRQQAYQRSKPKVGSFESNTSNSSQQSDARKLPPNSNSTRQASGGSRNHAQGTGIETSGDKRPTHPAAFPTQKHLDIGVSSQQITSDSETETTLSNSSEEVISPKRTLREALKTRGPYAMKPDEQSQSNHSPLQNAPPNRNPTPGPRRSLSIASQNSTPPTDGDWRIVSQNNTATTPSQSVTQQNAAIPKATMRAKLPSVEDNHQISKSHTLTNGSRKPQQSNVLPRYQRMNTEPTHKTPYTASKSTEKSYPALQLNHQEPTISNPHKSSTSSDERDNPFNAMDEEEISSIVEKIPGRTTTATRSGSESDIMEKLEKSRMGKKAETLEERTARILGIHRRTSTDDSANEMGSGSKKPATNIASSAEPKKDLNAYMNNLLTGVTAVSPATKQKYLSSDNAQTKGMSPLVTNSVSSSSKAVASHGKQGIQAKISKQRHPAEESDRESHSSGDEGKANLARASPVSPHGKMLLSYGNNIYAETPGFHKQQRSYDSTESDENYGADEREQRYKGSSVHNPSTQKQSSAMTPSRSEGISDSQDNYHGSPKPNAAGLSVWSRSRDVARDKIAKSIGFNLQNVNDPATPESMSVRISSDEYDIKILTLAGKNTHEDVIHANGEVANSTDSQSSEDDDDDGGRLEQVMHSIGLDPSAAWTMSV